MSTAERSTPTPEPEPIDVDEDDLMTVPDRLVEGFLVTNRARVRKLKAAREQSPSAYRDEMWEGIYVVSPGANPEHQVFAGELVYVFRLVTNQPGRVKVLPGLNVSDRIEDWKANYREPDVAVYLAGNPAIFHKAHACGGPDFAVEILSEGDLARKKLEFYAKVNTRELLILDRKPWALELYRLLDGRLERVGVSKPRKPVLLASEVLPLSFRLIPGDDRPTLEVAKLDGGTTWRV